VLEDKIPHRDRYCAGVRLNDYRIDECNELMAGVIVDVDAKGHATGFETRLTNANYFLPERALLVFVVFLTAFVAVNFFPALIFFVAFIGFDLAFLFGLSADIWALTSDFFPLFFSESRSVQKIIQRRCNPQPSHPPSAVA
jgi:hypothetical protein